MTVNPLKLPTEVDYISHRFDYPRWVPQLTGPLSGRLTSFGTCDGHTLGHM